MTPDAEGAKAFYDAVVGWNIGEAAPEFNGYRMIGRSDGGFAGGVLPLTDEMQQHGARPTWLGYIHVADVDQAVGDDRAGRRQGADAGVRHPQRRPDRDGRRPAGRALLRDEADPAGRRAERAERRLLARPASSASAGTSCRPATPTARADFYGDQFGWGSDDFMDMGEMGEYRFIDQHGTRIGALCDADATGQRPHWRYYIRRAVDLALPRTLPKRGGGTDPHGPARRSRPAITSSSAAIRRAPSSRSSAASNKEAKT